MQKINLPDKNSYQYETLEILGWGIQNYNESQNNYSSYSFDLKYANVKLVDLNVCRDHYKEDGLVLYENQICVRPIEGSPSKVNTFSVFKKYFIDSKKGHGFQFL